MQSTRVQVASADNLCRQWFRAAQFALKIIYLIERRFGEGYSWPTRIIVRGNEFSFDSQKGKVVVGGGFEAIFSSIFLLPSIFLVITFEFYRNDYFSNIIRYDDDSFLLQIMLPIVFDFMTQNHPILTAPKSSRLQ